MSLTLGSKLKATFIAALWICLLFALQSSLIVASEVSDALSSVVFESGLEGSYPLYDLKSAPEVISPRFNFAQWSEDCQAASRDDDARFIFVAPRGWEIPSRMMIFDEGGELVWSGNEEKLNAYDFKKQLLNDQPVLTYWTGNDEVKGHGSGEYHILDQSYNLIRTVKAGNDLEGDLHEFIITQQNTAILTIYERQQANLTCVGGTDQGKIWDSLFQEIDLATDEVIFQWRATDHLGFVDTYRSLDGDGGTNDDHWDWFHINSIEKDLHGNFLISARYAHSLMYIDGSDGHIIWNLGGKLNDFSDVSNSGALAFAGQHDARWHDNHTSITLFDNGADYDTHITPWSRGLQLAVNVENRTVELIQEYIDPLRTRSVSQGSMQVLSNGNVLLGFGFNAFMTEFDARGNVLCDMHLMPGARTDSGDVQSYRAYKDSWQGFPSWPPSLVIQNNTAYVSWNGATEVAVWLLKSSIEESGLYEEVLRTPREGFETQIEMISHGNLPAFIKAVALDSHGLILGESEVKELPEIEVSVEESPSEAASCETTCEQEVADKLTNQSMAASGWTAHDVLLPAGLVGTALTILIVFNARRVRRSQEVARGRYNLLQYHH